MRNDKELYKDMIYGFYGEAKTVGEKLEAVQPYIKNMKPEAIEVLFNDLLDTVKPKVVPKIKIPEVKKTPKTVRNTKPTILSDLSTDEE